MKTTIDRSLTQAQWNALRYPVQLYPLSEAEGGGYLATIPLLGEATCAADGETVEEALQNLEEYRRSLFEIVKNSQQPLPLPPERPDEERKARPAGKWLMRATPELHAALQKAATREGVSFNTYCALCLERGLATESVGQVLQAEFAALKSALIEEMQSAVRLEVRSQFFLLQSDLSFARAKTAFEAAEISVTTPRLALVPLSEKELLAA